jgi:hypothetical protein
MEKETETETETEMKMEMETMVMETMRNDENGGNSERHSR